MHKNFRKNLVWNKTSFRLQFFNLPPPLLLLSKLKIWFKISETLAGCWTKFGEIDTKLYPVLGESIITSLMFNIYSFKLK